MDNEYHAEYNLNRYHKRRAEFVDMLGGRCVVCGTTENLEFDHIDPATKAFPIGRLLNVSKQAALDELEKCQLLCKSHHIVKGHREKDQGQVGHGEGVSGKRNCKCALCKAKKAEYMREYKARNK